MRMGMGALIETLFHVLSIVRPHRCSRSAMSASSCAPPPSPPPFFFFFFFDAPALAPARQRAGQGTSLIPRESRKTPIIDEASLAFESLIINLARDGDGRWGNRAPRDGAAAEGLPGRRTHA